MIAHLSLNNMSSVVWLGLEAWLRPATVIFCQMSGKETLWECEF